MNNSNFLKVLLILQTLAVSVYTILVFQKEGGDLLSVFLADLKNIDWNGQFNLDFSSYLTLSTLWIMWRNRFSVTSIVIAIVAGIIGIIVFAPYVLVLLIQEKGDLKKVLVGNR
ncbi:MULTISPECIES: hypothetical protein [Chryseobacterium]|uniref:DUF1475 domain-containing protein n=1 Tax=Chryseobacterium taihuense TaxID=1141221 RepID=A0A4U8WCD0_9FLAO|nr:MULTISPECIES: hypothetical protein [Chryseobacterium]QQV03495.1 hypothetical protein I6I61_03895 [Chryseobacterium sp. FDAARGOS 1104]VFB03176.1 Uncharacterised protein [Chryseobacterium taihuense]